MSRKCQNGISKAKKKSLERKKGAICDILFFFLYYENDIQNLFIAFLKSPLLLTNGTHRSFVFLDFFFCLFFTKNGRKRRDFKDPLS